MKTRKPNNLMWLLLAFVLIMPACDNAEGDGRDETEALSTEQSKDQLDESMTSMANDLDGLSTLKSIDVTASMMDMEMDAPPFEDLVQPMSEVQGTSLEDMEEAMENGVLAVSLSDQTKWGTYDYNFTSGAFDFTEGAIGTFVINSPSSDDQTTNDVELKLTVVFQDVDIVESLTYTEEDEYYTPGVGWEYVETDETFNLTVYEVFTDINFTIKQDDDLLIAYEFSAELDADDMPEKMTTALIIEDYKIETTFDASMRNSKVSHGTSFTLAGDEMLGYDITFNGDLSDERIEEIRDEIEIIDETEEIPSDEFLASLDYDMEAEFRFGNFIINGIADAGKLYDAYDEFTNPDEFDDQSLSDMQYAANALNESMALVLKKEDGSLAGKAEVYVGENTEEGYYWDEDNEREVYGVYTEYELLLRFKFADGTYISPEDEDPEGELEKIFADFINAIEDFAEKMEEAGQKVDIDFDTEEDDRPDEW